MNAATPNTYLKLAYDEIPRILSLQDRNPFSKSYGCFHRSYWLHRTSDFPAAIAQLGVHSLALLWARRLEGNPYFGNPKILEWCIAGMEYWMKIQKSDGSFDEWYPNERGWAGPTGYLLHAMVDSYFLIQKAYPAERLGAFKDAVRRAGHYLAKHGEEFVLANHHAIALLPMYEAYILTGDESLKRDFGKRFDEFLTYCCDEGWSLEYDGADIGYQAGSISFLARLHKHWPSPEIENQVSRFIDFTSYHLYPDGTYGGSTGSRQTVHFYPFGYEYWSRKFPLAAAMAERGLAFYQQGKLVAPGTQEDHYVLYRVPEFIEAYMAHGEFRAGREPLPPLPYEGPDLERTFPKAGLFVKKAEQRYWVVNLCRGGVIKGFDLDTGQAITNNAGWIAKLQDGRVITSQWNDLAYEHEVSPRELRVTGQGHFMVTNLFTPEKMILFRLFLILFGWHAMGAYKIKALIRRFLTVGARKGPVRFERTILFPGAGTALLRDKLWLIGENAQIEELQIGDEFPVRYVPQSRYFQLTELTSFGRKLTQQELDTLNSRRSVEVETVLCAE